MGQTLEKPGFASAAPAPVLDSCILIVDDARENVRLLERTLQKAGYHRVHGTTDPLQALPLFQDLQPDLVLLDLLMPELDGFEVMAQLRARIPAGVYLPILVLTGDLRPESREAALTAGARDYLTKPFDRTEILLRIRNLLETRHLYLQLEAQNHELEERVRDRSDAFEASQQQLLQVETEKKRFYRDVIRAVTQDRFHLVDSGEIPTEGELLFRLSLAEPSAYAVLRARLREIALGRGMDEEVTDDLVLSVGEAVTNAIKHACEGHCEIRVTADCLVIRVSDCGCGIRPEDLPASILRPGYSTKFSLGMGYTIMLRLVDRVWLATGRGGTVVQLEKSTRPGAPNPGLAGGFSPFDSF